MDQTGLRENTVVIYTADQGHFLGEHGFISKRFMYVEAMQIPLIIRYPGLVRSHLVIEDLVENTDFAPTILDFAGMVIPQDIQGRSLLPLLREERPG